MKKLRITVAGGPGSGRTTVANYLADILKLNNFGVEVIDYPSEDNRSERDKKRWATIEAARKMAHLGSQGVEVVIVANQTLRHGVAALAHQSVDFEVGNRYKTFGGQMVKVVERKDEEGYQAILGKDNIWRYNRDSDRGRVTGSAHDFSDPDNLIPLYETQTAGIIEDLRIDLSLANNEIQRLKKQLASLTAVANAEVDA